MIWLAGALLAYFFIKFGILLLLTKVLFFTVSALAFIGATLAAVLFWRTDYIKRLFRR